MAALDFLSLVIVSNIFRMLLPSFEPLLVISVAVDSFFSLTGMIL
jgi:hypothetical protein